MDDWDRTPIAPPSIWLKLKTKDEQVRIRIAASPYREVQVWPEERGGQKLDPEVVNQFTPGQWMTIKRDPDWNVSEVYHLLVIDRADNQAKIFQASGAIYGKIREYAKNPEWGNPAGYDITIKRTEKPGSYWEITPSPNKSDLLAGERSLVDAIIDKLPPGALPSSGPQPDDIDENVRPEPLPWEKHLTPMSAQDEANMLANSTRSQPPATPIVKPAEAEPEPDVVIEDISDEPINLDDIPFN